MCFSHEGSEAKVFGSATFREQKRQDVKEFRIKEIKNITSPQGVK